MQSRLGPLALLGLMLAMLASALPARAADDPVTPLDTTLSDEVIEARIRFIEERLDARQLNGQIWYWSWMTLNGGAMVGLGIAAGLADDNDDRVNNGVNAGLAAMGVGDLLFRPLEARFGAEPIRGLPEATRQEKIDKLRAAERLLRANAERAEERTSWTMQGRSLAVAAVSGLAIGLAGDPKDAAISAVANALGGVAYLLTAPAGPADDWEAYERMTGKHEATADVRLTVNMLPGGGRLGLAYRW